MEMKINEFDMFCDFRERKVKREEGGGDLSIGRCEWSVMGMEYGPQWNVASNVFVVCCDDNALMTFFYDHNILRKWVLDQRGRVNFWPEKMIQCFSSYYSLLKPVCGHQMKIKKLFYNFPLLCLIFNFGRKNK